MTFLDKQQVKSLDEHADYIDHALQYLARVVHPDDADVMRIVFNDAKARARVAQYEAMFHILKDCNPDLANLVLRETHVYYNQLQEYLHENHRITATMV